jgi:hypothetical protein
LIHSKKTIVLFERHCHGTEKSEAIACARRCWSSPVNKMVDPKKNNWKNGGSRRRRRGTRVADPKKFLP